MRFWQPAGVPPPIRATRATQLQRLCSRASHAAAVNRGEYSCACDQCGCAGCVMRVQGIGMNAIAIPSHELKRNTWYYGVQCICRRLLALGEDSFAGNGEEHHVSAVALEVPCECGAVTRTQVLHKFKTA